MATEIGMQLEAAKWPVDPPKFFGLRELRLPEGTPLDTDEDVAKALAYLWPDHVKNRREIHDMYRRYLNEQPILGKTRCSRPELNNITLENWLWAIVQFKLGFEAPDGVTYNSADKDKEIKAIDVLNTCARLDNEGTKSQEADMWKFVCGTSFKMCRPEDPDEVEALSGDLAPYYTAVLDPRAAGVAYSADARKRPVLSFTYSEEYGEDAPVIRLQAFTRTKKFVWRIKGIPGAQTVLNVLPQVSPTNWVKVESGSGALFPQAMPIVETRLNPNRMGYVALLAILQDAINKLQSGRLDGIDNFLEALIVFINCQPPTDEDTDEWKTLQSGDVLAVKGTPLLPASVQYLVAQMDQNGAQITKEDLLNAFFEIGGMPSRNARSGGGQDTGQASFLRDGWGDADTRANISAKEARAAEMELLRVKLGILRATDVPAFDIRDLTLADVFVDIPRNRNNNMYTKAQTLETLLRIGVDTELAFQAVNLFEDPNAAAELSAPGVAAALGRNTGSPQDVNQQTVYQTQAQTGGSASVPTNAL